MFNSIRDRYEKGWIRTDQLKRYVELGIITKDEYKTICGIKYVA